MDMAVALSCVVPNDRVGAVGGSHVDQKLGDVLFRGGHSGDRG